MPSIEKIILDIYEHVRPIDAHSPNDTTLINPKQLWVDVVDPMVVMLDWSVDGVLISSKASESFDPGQYIDTPGDYVVTARAWDEVIEHAFSDNLNPHKLDLVRKNLEKLEQSVSWNISIETPDSDGDGTADDIDAFPDNPLETSDTDGDGVGDNADVYPDDPEPVGNIDDGIDQSIEGSDSDLPDTSDETSNPSDSTRPESQPSGGTGTVSGLDLTILMLLALSVFRKKTTQVL